MDEEIVIRRDGSVERISRRTAPYVGSITTKKVEYLMSPNEAWAIEKLAERCDKIGGFIARDREAQA